MLQCMHYVDNDFVLIIIQITISRIFLYSFLPCIFQGSIPHKEDAESRMRAMVPRRQIYPVWFRWDEYPGVESARLREDWRGQWY